MYQDVVHIDRDMPGCNQFFEEVVHHSLERGLGIGESEEHDQGFEGSFRRLKRCFPLIPFFDPDVVVSPSYV